MIGSIRTVGLVLTALLVVSSSALVGAVPDQNDGNETDDWPAPRADPGQTGATNDTGPQPYGNVSVTAAGQIGAQRTAVVPVVAGDTVFLAYGGEDAPDGFVEANDAATGETRWRQANVGEPVGPPSVHDGSVYVATAGPESREFPDSVNTSGLYSLDAETGEIEWRQNATITEPVVAEDTIFTSLRDDDSVDEPYRNVTALDPDTGERVWTADVHGKPAGYANDTLYVTENESNTVYALDPATGELRWRTDVADDALFDNGFAVTDSVFLYTNADRDDPIGEPKPKKTVYAHSARDGERVWERNLSASLPESRAIRLSGPAVSDGTVYLTSDDTRELRQGPNGQDVGAVHALDAATGETVWRFETAEDLTSAPVVGNGSVYVGGTATYALDAQTGTEQWNLSYGASSEGIADAPLRFAVANERLFVTDRSQGLPPTWRLYAIEPSETAPGPSSQVGDDEPTVENKRPIPEIRASPKPEDGHYPPNTTVTLDASGSVDLDGSITEFRWYLDDELIGTGQTVNVTSVHSRCAQQTVRLEVTDDGAAGGVSQLTDETSFLIQTGP